MKTSERYEIIEQLGSGGFGSVFRAMDTTLQREVAVKRLDRVDNSDSVRQQLLAEARVLASIQHPNIVSIYDVHSNDDADEIIMELISGVNLSTFVKKHLLIGFDFKNVALQILDAMHSAHNAGVLHCDLKPENIMLSITAEGHYEVKIYDFGMSVSVDHSKAIENSKLTGSIYMMAPELFNGSPPTKQSDIYALGCIFYYILTGAYPFNGDNSVQVMAMHISGSHSPLASIRDDLDPALCDLIQNLINKDLPSRLPSCQQAIQTLSEIVFTENDDEFTLPTTLKLESTNSLVVRPINVDSLTGSVVEIPAISQAVYANTANHSAPINQIPEDAPEGVEPYEPTGSLQTTPAKALPSKAEWFFNIKGAVKGPVELEKLQSLCTERKIKRRTLVWHPHFGEWIRAKSCAETKGHLRRAAQKPPNEVTQPATETNNLFVSSDRSPSITFETITILLGATICLWTVYFHPDSLYIAAATYATLIFVVGLVYSRIHQLKSGKSWFTFCLLTPVLGDILHAIAKPTAKSILAAIMLITGATHLGFFALEKVKSTQLSSSHQSSDIEHQSTPLLASSKTQK